MDNDTLALVLIFGTRGLAPLAIFRWPFWGGLLCILFDGTDVIIEDAIAPGVITDYYHNIDKAFDTYYLAVEAFVAFRWDDPFARWTATGLFSLRVLAVVIYELTELRGAFFYLGPNIFENFFVFVAGMRTIDPAYRIGSAWKLALIVVIVAAPKLLQEYVMHYRDSQTWHFVKRNLLLWD
jgi:hypothetical protein